MAFLSYLLIFVFTPVLIVWFFRRLDSYLSQKFPLAEEEKKKMDYLLSKENPDRDKYERYAWIEFGIFMVLFVTLLAILFARLPYAGLKNADTLMLFNMGPGLFLVFFPAMGLAIAIAAYAANFTIKAIYKVFNPRKDTYALYYTSRVMNAPAAGFDTNYNPKNGNRALLVAFLLTYLICICLARSNVGELSRTYFRSGGIIFSKNYNMKDIDLNLYSRDTKTYLQIMLTDGDVVLFDDEVKGGWIIRLQKYLQSR